MFEYKIINQNERVTVFFKGDMDIEVTEIIEEEIIPALLKFTKIEIDFSNVPFVDSTGIGLLINLVQHLKEHQIVVTITQLIDSVYEVFDLLQIPEILGREVFLN